MELNILGLAILGAGIAAIILGGCLIIQRNGKSLGSFSSSLQVFLKAGWLLPFCICSLFFGAWLVDIVIPTLKGANFNQLYDLHGIRYLDIALVSFVVGFVWLAFVTIRGALTTRFPTTA